MSRSRTNFIQRVAIMLLTLVLTTASVWADNGYNYLFCGVQHNTYTDDHVADNNVYAITNETTELGASGGATTWYYVSGEVTCYNRIVISGTVNIILMDGCNFTIPKGIHVPNDNILNIYAQSAGSGCGSLTASHYYSNDAAIGGDGGQNEGYGYNGDDGERSGEINIYGGRITANGNIGGGNGSNAQATEDNECQAGSGGDGYVYIYGGIVTVDGNIGGGKGGTGENYSNNDIDNPFERYCFDGSNGGGSVTLSWSNLSDRIYATNYNVDYSRVTLEKDFYNATNQQLIPAGNASNLGGKTLQPGTERYGITISNSECLKADKSDASETEEVTLTAINGYTVSGVTVTGNVSVTDNQDGTFTFNMPANAVTVTATATHTHFEIAATDDVTLSIDNGDKLVQDGKTYYRAGATIPFTLTPPQENKELQALDVHHTDDANVTITPSLSGSTYSFNMPAADVTISPSWVQTSFSISKDEHMSLNISENGSVTINGNVYYKKGSTVTVSITPPDGKYVDGFSVKKGDNSDVDFTTNSNGSYTFTMPNADVTLHASYPVTINFTWTLTDEDQDGVDETLTITGTGAMTDFADWRDRPWNYNYENIKTVIISNGITSISNHAFNGCYRLTSVTIPNGVQRIGHWAFHSCSNVGLTSITIPGSVQTIGELAFSGCSYLSSFTIPASVTSIGSDAFRDCTNLTHVYCYADPENLTWSDGGYNDFIYDNGTIQGPQEHQETKCHVFVDKLDAFTGKWSTGDEDTDVNVEFLGDLAPYIDANGTTRYCNSTDVTVLNSVDDITNALVDNKLPAGWYLVNSNITYTSTITLNGAVNLILADGKTMTIGTSTSPISGQAISGNGNLTIYGQGGQTEGALTVCSSNNNAIHSNNITINGGIVQAKSNSNLYAIDAMEVTINGGQVTADGGINGFSGITLGWGKPTDFIQATSYYGMSNGVYIPNGKVFADGAGNIYKGSYNFNSVPFEGKIIQPCLVLNETDGATPLTTAPWNGVANASVCFIRTFTANVASTVCLPFGIDATQAAAAGKFYTFAGVDKTGAKWEVIMQETSPSNLVEGTLVANTPYLFIPATTGSVMFHGTASATISAGTISDTEGWTFMGTYDQKLWDDTNNTDEIGKVYGFAANSYDGGSYTVSPGDFVKAGSGASIAPFRAFLQYTAGGGNMNAPIRGVAENDVLPSRLSVRLVNADGTATEVGTINTNTGEISFDENWYDMGGHRLNSAPNTQGIYINNGKKVFIK